MAIRLLTTENSDLLAKTDKIFIIFKLKIWITFFLISMNQDEKLQFSIEHVITFVKFDV